MDLKLLYAFNHKTMRRTLKINMTQVKEDILKNETLRKMFGNIEPLSMMWWKRVLKFIGRAIFQPRTALSRQILSCFVLGKCRIGHSFRNVKYSLIENIRLLMPSMCHSGNFKHWGNYSSKKKWESMMSILGLKTYHKHQKNNNHSSRSTPPRKRRNNTTTSPLRSRNSSNNPNINSLVINSLRALNLHTRDTNR